MSVDIPVVERPEAYSKSDWSEFRIGHPREQVHMLERLCSQRVPIVLNAPDGTALPTQLWSVSSAEGTQCLAFAVDALSPQTSSLVNANEGTAVAYLESIKLQFDLSGFLLVRGPDGSTLQSGLPRDMYRFQRRDAYRVRTPSRCEPVVQFRHPGLPEMKLSLHMLDVSIGGCALWLPHDVPILQNGTLLGEVQVELDAENRFNAMARLQNLGPLLGQDRPTSAGKGRRMGCAWQALSGSAERVLQRWIDATQKRNRQLAAE
jgi:flagellar brake protein